MSNFSPGSIEIQRAGLSRLHPDDRVFMGKNHTFTNLYKLILGLARELYRMSTGVYTIAEESNLFTTEQLITEWERAVGIPDGCFDGTGTLEERRTSVIAKIQADGLATEDDFITMAAFLGYTITIIRFGDYAYPPFDVPFFPVFLPQGRFVWMIEGEDIVQFVPPYDVPFDLDVGSTVLQCFFLSLKPANTVLLFRNTNP